MGRRAAGDNSVPVARCGESNGTGDRVACSWGRGDEEQSQRVPSWEMYPRESARLLGLLFAWAAHGSDAVDGDGSSPGVNDVRRWLA